MHRVLLERRPPLYTFKSHYQSYTMSSEVKAEETPVVVEAPKIEGAPALVEAPAPVAEQSTSAPAATTETTAEVKEEVQEEDPIAEHAEVKTISEGWLEFKPHGILHFISTRRYFYLQDEPIEFENLQTYLKKEKKEKPEATHSTAAHASQTGKGLLFFSKTDAQKAHPIGIIKFSDVVEVTSHGTTKFALKLSHDVWNFEALNTLDRDSWVHTIKGKIVEAKDGAEAVTSSEGYKGILERFNKKPVVAKSETAKEKEKEKEDEKKEDDEEKEEKKDEEKEKAEEKGKKEKKKEKKEKKKDEGAKSDDSSDSSSSEDEGSSDKKGKKTKRSNSVKGKRTSIFDILGGKGKKHEKEEKKEEKVEEKKEEEVKTEEPKAETAGEGSSEVPVPAVTEEVKSVEEIKPVEETPKSVESPAAEEVTTPKGTNKRHSIFSFFDKKKEVEKKDVVEPIKERDVVSDTPPVIAPIGEEQKPTETEESKPIEAAGPATVDIAKSPSSPPKESFLDKFGLFKSKDKAPAAAAAAPEPEAKKEDVVETKPEDTEVAKEGEAVKETDEKVAEAASPKDAKRRSSFFSLGKKDKKPADVKSDTEEEPSSKSNPTSPLPKKLSLFRKNSKSAKDAPKTESEEVPPVPEVAPLATETPASVPTEAPAPVVEETPAATQTTTTTAPATTV